MQNLTLAGHSGLKPSPKRLYPIGILGGMHGVTYTYLTNDNNLPSCQIVLLYKHRWDIEKRFRQFKSKMGERKSWASSLETKESHAIVECLAHNLLLLFETHIGRSEGLCDETESEQEEGGTTGPAGIIRALGNFINTAIQRATQRTQRFVRWVRVWIYREAAWGDSIARLRQVWAGRTTQSSTPIHRSLCREGDLFPSGPEAASSRG